MLKTMRKQGGFTLIEVVAAAALIGIMATMLLPSLSGANDRVKNARLQNDLVTIDQAIQRISIATELSARIKSGSV